MKALRTVFSCLIALVMTVGIGLNGYADTPDRFKADVLYVGDGGDNSIKSFNANTGDYLGKFIPNDNDVRLIGPMGLIFVLDKLLIVNQNVDQQPLSGEILRYQRDTGDFIDALVPACTAPCNSAPFAPRGIVRGLLPTVYVADLGDFSPDNPGKVMQFGAFRGKFIRNLDTAGFGKDFFPRGIVFGPDGLIYVSVTGNLASGDPLSAYILRFNPITGKFNKIFAQYKADSKDCSKDFHRPEGLVFGPDGNLYVTSFRNNGGNITSDPQNVDSVLVFNRSTGNCISQIPFYNPVLSQPRTFAQAILFGPNGRLFASMNNTGEIRSYDVEHKTYKHFVNIGGPLVSPWYMTFGKTDPSTLEYGD